MINEIRLREIVNIEKNRLLEEFKEDDLVKCECVNAYGAIHHIEWLRKDEFYKVDRMANEDGFVCFASTPNRIKIICAALLYHYGVAPHEEFVELTFCD